MKENPINYEISTDKRKLDINLIHSFLSNSYWAKGINLEEVKKRIKNSLCFGIYTDKKQIGFARVITDYVTIAYLADVFIIAEYRKRGLSKELVKFILSNDKLKRIKSWMLATNDAHNLYSKFGFKQLENPEKYMLKRTPEK